MAGAAVLDWSNTNVVLDNLTGLMWARDARLFPAVDWAGAVRRCARLRYGDFADWRLPDRRELLSLIDAGNIDPALPAGHPFINIQQEFYWSCTKNVSLKDCAYTIDMYGALTVKSTKNMLNVWPVRCGRIKEGQAKMKQIVVNTNFAAATVPKTSPNNSPAPREAEELKRGARLPDARFTMGANTNVVLDNMTGLMWVRDAKIIDAVDWAKAVQICNDLDYGGYSDWRLPNRLELLSLMDDTNNKQTLPAGHPFKNINTLKLMHFTDHQFNSVQSDQHYWSSTFHPRMEDYAINVDLYYGVTSAAISKKKLQNVWPVRGGKRASEVIAP